MHCEPVAPRAYYKCATNAESRNLWCKPQRLNIIIPTMSIHQENCRHHGGLRLDCPYRDAFAGATQEPLPPFHILTINREQFGTSAPCSQGNQNIRGVITQGNLPIVACIRGYHLTSS